MKEIKQLDFKIKRVYLHIKRFIYFLMFFFNHLTIKDQFEIKWCHLQLRNYIFMKIT